MFYASMVPDFVAPRVGGLLKHPGLSATLVHVCTLLPPTLAPCYFQVTFVKVVNLGCNAFSVAQDSILEISTHAELGLVCAKDILEYLKDLHIDYIPDVRTSILKRNLVYLLLHRQQTTLHPVQKSVKGLRTK